MLRSLRPVFGCRSITAIWRHDYERYLLETARSFSKSSVRSLHVALLLVLSYSLNNDWLEKNPVRVIRLPRYQIPGRESRFAVPADLVRRLQAQPAGDYIFQINPGELAAAGNRPAAKKLGNSTGRVA